MKFTLKNLMLAVVPWAISAAAVTDEMHLVAVRQELRQQGITACATGDLLPVATLAMLAAGVAIICGWRRTAAWTAIIGLLLLAVSER